MSDITLKLGSEYFLRNGRRVKCTSVDCGNEHYPCELTSTIVGVDEVLRVTTNGRNSRHKGEDSSFDVIRRA